MKLHIFQSAQGDCLLLEGGDQRLVLCDGGMDSSLRKHVRDELTKLRTAGRALDYIYVSHIDQDHISGVLQLLRDEVDWRIFDFETSHPVPGGAPPTPPDAPRPPEINGILQNSFSHLIGVNTKDDVDDLLAVAVPSFFATGNPKLVEAALALEEFAVSIPEALEVSRLIASDALDIPVNQLPGTTGPAKLLFFRDTVQSFPVGGMTFTIVGPGHDELDNVRIGWVTWLRANRDNVRTLRKELKKRIEEFTDGTRDSLFDLTWNGIPDFKGVTAPNVASLMFMVEEGGKRLLLTGDSQQDKILDGLRRTGFLDGAGLHVDVLKVQHHGSDHNLDAPFARQVSARNYVFCANGSDGNPDPAVIDIIFNSRRGPASARALAAPPNEPFHFWFSTASSMLTPNSVHRQVFEALEQKVEGLRQSAQGQLVVHFNSAAFHTLEI